MKSTSLIAIVIAVSFKSYAQDFIRSGVAFDFKQEKAVQTFSFDLNRTEKVDEKTGAYLRYGKNDFYILPSVDVNLGEGVTSSENNVLAQMILGQGFIDATETHWGKNNEKTTVFNQALEFNPSYNSDKLFQEKLGFGQVKYLFNIASSKHKTVPTTYVRAWHSISLGAFANAGYRYSSTYKIDNFYSIAGGLFDYQTQILDSTENKQWVFKVSAKYYYIAAELRQLTNQDYAGMFKASVDKLIWKRLFIGVSYKYGNDNPTYKTVHTLETSIKFNLEAKK